MTAGAERYERRRRPARCRSPRRQAGPAGFAVRLAVGDDGLDPERPAGTQDAQRDLAAVRDEDLAEHRPRRRPSAGGRRRTRDGSAPGRTRRPRPPRRASSRRSRRPGATTSCGTPSTSTTPRRSPARTRVPGVARAGLEDADRRRHRDGADRCGAAAGVRAAADRRRSRWPAPSRRLARAPRGPRRRRGRGRGPRGRAASATACRPRRHRRGDDRPAGGGGRASRPRGPRARRDRVAPSFAIRAGRSSLGQAVDLRVVGGTLRRVGGIARSGGSGTR